VKRFGGEAKVLRRVEPAATDSRSFLEVVKQNKMDRKFQGVRNGREGRDFREERSFGRTGGEKRGFHDSREWSSSMGGGREESRMAG
jgi:hypothetical protein